MAAPNPRPRRSSSAARIRLRPILHDHAGDRVSAILPIALGLGAGAEARKPLGMAVVGGMLLSTLLTLVVVPVFYTLLARWAGDPLRAKDEQRAEAVGGALATPARH